jgi:predicted transcriptional regulator
VKWVVPVVRAMVAKELIAVDGLRQADVAKLLRVSQPARHDVYLHEEEAILIPSIHISTLRYLYANTSYSSLVDLSG